MLSAAVAGALVGSLGWAGWISAQARRRTEGACPPIGQFVDAGDCRLHYVERGSGPPVVLLHGASANLRDFCVSILDRLAERHRVIAFDRPGYGYSTRPRAHVDPAAQARYVRTALHALGVEQPVLVGHSWAGSLVLAYALQFPKELRGVVTLSGASHPWRGGVALYRYLGASPVIGPMLASTVIWPLGRRMADAAIRAVLSPAEPPAGYRESAGIDLLFRSGQFRADAVDVSRLCAFLREQSPRYGELEVPLTIVTGSRDRIVSPRLHSHALHSQVAQSKLVVLEDAGHAPHHSRPEDVIREIALLTGVA